MACQAHTCCVSSQHDARRNEHIMLPYVIWHLQVSPAFKIGADGCVRLLAGLKVDHDLLQAADLLRQLVDELTLVHLHSFEPI